MKELKKWMPMFWDAYFGGTQHFETCSEHGAYLLLIAYCWSHGGALPRKDEDRRRIAKATSRQWAVFGKRIVAKFDSEGRNKRCSEELAYAIEKSKTMSANAKQRYSNGSAEAYTPTPTPTKKERKKTLAQKMNGHHRFDELWALYPRKSSKRTAEKAYLAALKHTTHENIVAALERAKQSDHRFRESQFTPYLASWLNGGGWEDEIASKPKPSESGFVAASNTPEFEAWRAYARDTGKHSFVRVLDERRMEGRSFEFETQWPPSNGGGR